MTTPKTGSSKTYTKANVGVARLTKKALLIRMLTSKSGTDIAAISKKLGWQNHTTRAALTGLRKVGLEIAAEKAANGKPTRYRIIGMSAPTGSDPPGAEDNAG